MGILTLVTLPIGDMLDLTPKARQALINSSFILAEDTRVIKSTLKEQDIDYSKKKIISFHDHNDESKFDYILDRLGEGTQIVLVSDAGSPIISDPAYPLISRVIKKGFTLKNCSGVTSIISALELSALPAQPFSFHGFFPRESEKRKKVISKILEFKGTHIFFDSPKRIKDSLLLFRDILPEANVSVCRELSKTYESVYRFKAVDFDKFSDEIIYKGEFVFLVEISKNMVKFIDDNKLLLQVDEYLSTGGSKKQLAKIFSMITGKKVKDIYNQML